MEPSRICVAWQNRSSPPPSSGRMKPNPLWFHAIQTPVLRGPPSPPNSPRLGAPPASRAPGLRERRGGERERGRGAVRLDRVAGRWVHGFCHLWPRAPRPCGKSRRFARRPRQ